MLAASSSLYLLGCNKNQTNIGCAVAKNTTQTKMQTKIRSALASPQTKYDNQKYSMHWGQRGTINNTECLVGDGGQGRPRLLLIVIVGLASDEKNATKIRNKKIVTLG